MESRERLEIALEHKEADRIPIDLNGSNVTGICSGAYKDFICYLEEEKGIVLDNTIYIEEQIQQLAFVEDKIKDLFGVDTIKFNADPPFTWKFIKYENEKNYYYEDEWGVTWRMPKDTPRYFDTFKRPLAGLSIDELKKYAWPDPTDHSRFENLRNKAELHYKTTDKAIIAGHPIGPGILEEACWMTGMEEFLVNMLTDKKKSMYVLNKINEIYIEAWDKYLDEIGDYISVCILSEDLGTQTGSLISIGLYKEMIEPLIRKNISLIKKKTKAKVFLHSCGDVSEFIPSLIDIGVDILNPVQISASNMDDTKKLNREYGDHIVFWGAACDPQRILPFGSIQDVADEVKRRIDELACGGGFIFAPVHNIQAGVPPENILAMFDTALQYGKYAM